MTPATVRIRDSKDRDGAQFAVRGGPWARFLDFAQSGAMPPR
ncbi:DUF397 domain-containing protein [Streptomyces sp. NPDC007251]